MIVPGLFWLTRIFFFKKAKENVLSHCKNDIFLQFCLFVQMQIQFYLNKWVKKKHDDIYYMISSLFVSSPFQSGVFFMEYLNKVKMYMFFSS